MTTVRQFLAIAATTAGLLCAGGAAAEPVTFSKDAPLRSEPRFDAAPAAQIKQGTVGEQIGKKSPWINVKLPQATGWALVTDVNYGSGGSSTGRVSLARTGTAVGGTTTLGARGLDKESIGTALGDGGAVSTAQLALLDGYAVTKEDSQSFASGKGLSAASVAY